MDKNDFNACLFIIGNEILSGRTQDSNVKFIGEKLNLLGIRLLEVRIIPDVEEVIVHSIRDCKERFDYIFTTGGIGPTHDDITAKSIARACNRQFERNARAEELLRNFYLKKDITEARMSMADMPKGAILLDNPISKAPGFKIENIFVLPGVPSIVEGMFDKLCQHLVGGSPILSKSITSFIPEGKMGGPLGDVQLAHPKTEIGSYPFFRNGKIGANLVIRARDINELESASKSVRNMIYKLGGNPVEI